jgi:glucans biosynthesis protein
MPASPIRRRTFLASLATAGVVRPRLSAAADPIGFTFETVKNQALALAKQPYRADPTSPLPQVLKDLDYAHFQMIKFRPEQALWRGNGLFQVRLIHRGFQYDRKVTINLVENGEFREVSYDPAWFDFGLNKFATDFDPSLGFAGLRLDFPLNRPDDFDEFAVFSGASYFRMVGRGQRYGCWARCLAIDTAGPQGEEFPALTTFWLERPGPDATTVNVYALLESKSVTGAYSLAFTPGTETHAHVEGILYPRLDIEKLGLAPLNSMFLHGKPGNRLFADLRPEVHDSDAIVQRRGNGEWLSRPLLNPRLLRVSAFSDQGPKGFGLVQREGDFQQYQDTINHYETRPSLWVEPQGDWAAGRIELVEIPNDDEINDNIVAYWVPQQPIKAGTPMAFAYGLTALPGSTPLPRTGRCIGTRTGPVAPADVQAEQRGRSLRFWIHFAGGELSALSNEMPVEAVITASVGKTGDMSCRKLDGAVWRASFTFSPDGRKDAELRAYLRLRNDALSETWTYRWAPD